MHILKKMLQESYSCYSVNDNLCKSDSILWLQHQNKLLFHDKNGKIWQVSTAVSIGLFVHWYNLQMLI
jgi:hypothetical protein